MQELVRAGVGQQPMALPALGTPVLGSCVLVCPCKVPPLLLRTMPGTVADHAWPPLLLQDHAWHHLTSLSAIPFPRTFKLTPFP